MKEVRKRTQLDLESFLGLLCDELALSLSFLLLDLDDCDLGDGGTELDGSMRDGDLEADLAGELCLLLLFSRLLERFSTLGDALAACDEALGIATGLPHMLVAVVRLVTELLFLELEKNRLNLGVLWTTTIAFSTFSTPSAFPFRSGAAGQVVATTMLEPLGKIILSSSGSEVDAPLPGNRCSCCCWLSLGNVQVISN